MSSLQEQLLKAGLVDESRAKQASKEKQKRANLSRKSAGKAATKKKAAAPTAAQRRQAERAERDRALNEQRRLAGEQKAITAQVRQLVQDNKQERGKGATAIRRMNQLLASEGLSTTGKEICYLAKER